MAQGVKGAGLDERFNHAAVDCLVGTAGYKVGKVGVGTVGGAFFDDDIGSTLADAFDRGHAEADTAAVTRQDRCEVGTGGIDIGAEHRHVHGVALLEEGGDLIGIALFGGEHGRHELDRSWPSNRPCGN